MAKTPMLDKMLAYKDELQTISHFLDWLKDKHIVLSVRHHHDDMCRDNQGLWCGYQEDELQPISSNFERILADYYEIDLRKVEQERQALLEEHRAWLRTQHD